MAVDRLTAEDRLMLWSDEGWPQDIGALAVLDGRALLDSDGRFRIDAAREEIERRLHLLPRFRQILYQPRRGRGWPLWVDAPGFDLRDHARVAQVPDPGDEAQLLLATEQLRCHRLDRSRPLWEIWFLPGLPDARIGLFIRLHHVIADGIASVAGLGSLLGGWCRTTAFGGHAQTRQIAWRRDGHTSLRTDRWTKSGRRETAVMHCPMSAPRKTPPT